VEENKHTYMRLYAGIEYQRCIRQENLMSSTANCRHELTTQLAAASLVDREVITGSELNAALHYFT